MQPKARKVIAAVLNQTVPRIFFSPPTAPVVAKPIRAESAPSLKMVMCFPATFTITAEAPLGNQAGIDTNKAGNSPDPNNGHNAGGTATKPPIPKFSLSFYNGGPMRVGGWKLPVVVKCSGVKCASDRIPIYAGHIDENTTATEEIEQLIGQTSGPSTIVQGCSLMCCGDVTGKSRTAQAVMDHASGGFQWQASLDAMPTKGHVIPEGKSEDVNGKIVAGPAYVADESILKNVAVVALGADTTARTHFAAEHAAWRSDMEFEAWLTAEYGMTLEEYKALKASKPAVHGTIQARWDGIGSNIAAGTSTGTGTVSKAAPGSSVRASATTNEGDEEIKALRAKRVAETRRISALDQLQAKYSKAEVEIEGDDGKKVTLKCGDYIAKAIEEGSDPRDVELNLLRARKPFESGSVPAGSVPFANTRRGFRKGGILGEYHGAPPSRGGRYEVKASTSGLTDDHCRVIEAAALISAGRTIGNQQWSEVLTKNKQYGEKCVQMAEDEMNNFGHELGPTGLMCMAARMAGMTDIPRRNADAYEEIRNFSGDGNVRGEFTTFQLPAILSNVMNKFMLDGYFSVDPNAGPGGGVAWQQFVRRGSVSDFKPNFRMRLIGNFKPKALGEGGEIETATMGDQSYKIQAAVQALLAGLPYQAIVDDDLNAFSTLPTFAGVGCGEKVARDVYAKFLGGYQSDGLTPFFTQTDTLAQANADGLTAFAHNWNLGATTALGVSGLTLAFQQFLNQVKPNGEPFGELPEILLAPVGLAVLAKQLYQDTELISALVSTSGSPSQQFGTNPHTGMYKPVISQYLSNALIPGNSPSTFYLTTAPTRSAYAVEAAFLNGSEMPIVERDEMSFDRLGIAFRWWLSYGIGMGEPRAAQKNSLS